MITCSVICAISLPIALSHDRDNDNNHEDNDVEDVDVDDVEPVVETKCRRDRDNDDDQEENADEAGQTQENHLMPPGLPFK